MLLTIRCTSRGYLSGDISNFWGPGTAGPLFSHDTFLSGCQPTHAGLTLGPVRQNTILGQTAVPFQTNWPSAFASASPNGVGPSGPTVSAFNGLTFLRHAGTSIRNLAPFKLRAASCLTVADFQVAVGGLSYSLNSLNTQMQDFPTQGGNDPNSATYDQELFNPVLSGYIPLPGSDGSRKLGRSVILGPNDASVSTTNLAGFNVGPASPPFRGDYGTGTLSIMDTFGGNLSNASFLSVGYNVESPLPFYRGALGGWASGILGWSYGNPSPVGYQAGLSTLFSQTFIVEMDNAYATSGQDWRTETWMCVPAGPSSARTLLDSAYDSKFGAGRAPSITMSRADATFGEFPAGSAWIPLSSVTGINGISINIPPADEFYYSGSYDNTPFAYPKVANEQYLVEVLPYAKDSYLYTTP